MPHTKLHGLGDTAEHSSATIAQLNALISDAVLGGVAYKSCSLTTQASGTYFTHGYYSAPAASTARTQAAPTQTYGVANQPYGAHAFIVAAAAGTASGGSGAVILKVTGTSITDAGVRTAADSETIVADITTASTNAYYESTKKWIGTVSFTLDPGATGHTSYALTFNYGLNKYEDFGNRDFTITDIEVVGRAGASDSGFNIELLHHKATGWTYHASAFVPGTTPIVNMNTDYGTEQDLTNGSRFAYKRAGLSTAVTGSGSEGCLIRVTTGANNSLSISATHIGVTYT